jgi:predicted small integral membrane protein
MIQRYAKILLVACVGALLLLVGLDNIFDYGTNFTSVQHILSMDTEPPGSAFQWRAIHGGLLHHVTYDLIMAIEIGAGAACLVGALKLLRARAQSAAAFNAAKDLAIGGLAAGIALYFFGFMTIGGEWFQMWRSQGWNAQEAAFRFVGSVGLILLFVSQPDAD